MSRAWAKGSDAGWRKTRAMVLERDGWQCQLKLPDVCTSIATHVHHTVGRSRTGDDPTYLVASCAECNIATGDPTKQPDPPPHPRTRW